MATTRNKVMWQEGMLMRPHHFQQQQRYNDYLDNQRFRAMNDLSWGFTELTLNNELLAQGKIMIDSASGTLPDGTDFFYPRPGRTARSAAPAKFSGRKKPQYLPRSAGRQ